MYEKIRKELNRLRSLDETPKLIIVHPEDEVKIYQHLNPTVDVGLYDDEVYFRPKLISTLLGVSVYRSHDLKPGQYTIA